MVEVEPVTIALAAGAIVVSLLSIPFLLTALDYRQRDNGLAYLLLVSGVTVWNAMFVAQLLSEEPMVKVFFLSLSIVGAVQAGLGWLLFASTASSTVDILDRREVYLLVSVLGGLDIGLAVTAPVHDVFWNHDTVAADTLGFATVEPAIGYWLHTLLLIGLFAAGTALFANRARGHTLTTFPLAYTVAGSATILAILASNVLAPGGLGVASIVAGGLTTVGWLQASRGNPLVWLRSLT